MNRGKNNTSKILLFHEFGPVSREWHQGPVADELCRLDRQVIWKHGWLSDYRAGGTGLVRIVNLIYCYLMFPWFLWWHRPDAVLVRSAPPGIQVWLSICGTLQGQKVVWWLMDYHPEIEARMLEKRGAIKKGLSRLLRAIDRWALKRTYAVIAIDRAIAKCVSDKSSKPRVVVYPTWSPEGSLKAASTRRDPVANTQTVTILHLGNFSFAHDLKSLRTLIGKAPVQWVFKLIVVNPSQRGRELFSELAATLDRVQVEFYSKKPLEEVARWIAEKRINWGLVTLDSKFAGTVSPSKFHTYLELNLPLLYIGPNDTNAAYCCQEYGAGVLVQPENPAVSLPAILALNTDREARRSMLEGVARAKSKTHDYGPKGFSNLILEILAE